MRGLYSLSGCIGILRPQDADKSIVPRFFVRISQGTKHLIKLLKQKK